MTDYLSKALGPVDASNLAASSSNHRRPPKPPWWNDPGCRGGVCRWCNRPTGGGCWHTACLRQFKSLFWWGVVRLLVWERDQGICRECGKSMATVCLLHRVWEPGDPGRVWEPEDLGVSIRHLGYKFADYHVDHIRPLADWPPLSMDWDAITDMCAEAPAIYARFGLDNLQLLCEDCHKTKTAEEAGRRAGRKARAKRDATPLMQLVMRGDV